MHTLVLGAGFSGVRIARDAAEHGSASGTKRTAAGVDELKVAGLHGVIFDGHVGAQLQAELAKTTHLVVSVAPMRTAPFHDPVLTALGSFTHVQLPKLQWIGYLSTIGVYGDHGGQWVNESTVCSSTQTRSLMRREAELAWQAFGQSLEVPVAVLRLSGIYGPARNAVSDAIRGRARMLIKPGQVFNRIHVEDLSQATIKAALASYDGVLNISDDLPAAPQDVIAFAHELAGKPAPPAQDFQFADISPMARSFYSENKRVDNQLSKSALDFDYRYPNYKQGLRALWAEIQETKGH
ncbi:MAG: SDR family oxidoreductase [Granulosicoccus sp.]